MFTGLATKRLRDETGMQAIKTGWVFSFLATPPPPGCAYPRSTSLRGRMHDAQQGIEKKKVGRAEMVVGEASKDVEGKANVSFRMRAWRA